jgi:1,4-alpha-glucan branching enzyme
MLWQGQEFADNYNIPDQGEARVRLRRDMHWEYFYDGNGQPLIRVYRILGKLRRSSRALRGPNSYYYFQQSHQGTIAYQRHAPPDPSGAEDWAIVLLNFSDNSGTISVPFPKAGKWKEMLNADEDVDVITVNNDGDFQTVTVPSNYGMIFFRQN